MTKNDLPPSARPMRLWTGRVLPDWLDYNGHMTEHRYLQVFGESSDALYAQIGVDFARAEVGAFYTLSTFIQHLAECKVATPLWTETEILGHDAKRLHLYHRLFDNDARLLATGEHLAIHVAASKACDAPQAMQDQIAARYALRAALPRPEGTGAVLRRDLLNMRPRA